MDSAIIGVLSRSVYLPPENPWFSGKPFTSYYYFGHLMAATLTRTFHTPLPYAYNLAQPLFCAFFISILWSLCASLTGSKWKGLAITALVGFCGNYEPMRQWYLAAQNASPLWPLNWWSTSRVIPHTINEYPFFTLALGDAHAHFFGLSLFVLFLCTCMTTDSESRHARTALLLQAIIASAVLMTNAWDFPILAFLAILLIWRQNKSIGYAKVTCRTIVWFTLVALLTLPFLYDFRSPSGGVQWDPRWPDASFLLVWGPFILLGLLVALKRKKVAPIRGHPPEDADANHSTLFILYAGVATLVFPYLFFIQGHFDGALRHQDTVFKFGLQSWLLLGIGMGILITKINPLSGRRPLLFGIAVSASLAPTILAPLSVFLARSARAPAQQLSLNGAHHLPPSEQSALAWLASNARPGDTIVESVGRNDDGTWASAYSDYGRVSSLTGIPASIGWPQHAIFWGATPAEVDARLKEMDEIYQARSQNHLAQAALNPQNTLPEQKTKNNLSQNRLPKGTRHLFWGSLENAIYGPPVATEPEFVRDGIVVFSIE